MVSDLDDDRAQSPLGREQAEGGRHRGLAHASLAGDHGQLAFEHGCHDPESLSETRIDGLDLQSGA
jgi:hypothetical protein